MKGNDMPVRHSTIKRRTIRTVIDNLILLAGHLTNHARKLRLTLGPSNGCICTFLRIAEAFSVLRNQGYTKRPLQSISCKGRLFVDTSLSTV